MGLSTTFSSKTQIIKVKLAKLCRRFAPKHRELRVKDIRKREKERLGERKKEREREEEKKGSKKKKGKGKRRKEKWLR